MKDKFNVLYRYYINQIQSLWNSLKFKYADIKNPFQRFCIPKRDLNLFHKINEKEIWPLFDKEFELRFLSNITENLKHLHSF